MTLQRRLATFAVIAASVFGGFVVGRIPAATPAAAATTYSITITGTDLHPLDAHVFATLVPNTGGGVEAVYDPPRPCAHGRRAA